MTRSTGVPPRMANAVTALPSQSRLIAVRQTDSTPVICRSTAPGFPPVNASSSPPDRTQSSSVMRPLDRRMIWVTPGPARSTEKSEKLP